MAACHGCSVISLALPPNMRNDGWDKVLSKRLPHVPTEETGWRMMVEQQ